jgi:hypothetical protein
VNTTLLLLAIAATSDEGFDRDAFSRAIRAHRGDVEACFKNTSATSGGDPYMYISWRVDPAGRSSHVEVEGTNVEPGQDCFVQSIQQLELPKAPGGGLIAKWRLDYEKGKLVDDEPELSLAPDLEAERKQREERLREEDRYELDHPPGIAEMWNMGGAGMYPVALGLLLGLAAGALALVLAFAQSGRAAVVVAGIALGGGAFAVSAGWLGYVNGMMGAYSAVTHVNPMDKAPILHAAEREASMCWKFGAIAFVPGAVLGLAAIALALSRKGPANV